MSQYVDDDELEAMELTAHRESQALRAENARLQAQVQALAPAPFDADADAALSAEIGKAQSADEVKQILRDRGALAGEQQ